ncbi:MAG: AI-2E family transporter [Flavobacteriaceae bacterium]|nr:AI-2E family transporter [Flavobacteriaceae bacterium]
MVSKIITNGILNALKKIIIFSLIIYFFYLIRPILIYLSISLVITIILSPLLLFLKTRLKFNNSIAAITSMSGLILIIGLLIKSFIPLLVEQARNLSLLNSTELQSSVNNIIEKYSDLYFTNDSNFINSIVNSKLFNQIDLSYITDLLNSIIASLGSFSIGIFTIIFITFFFLKDSEIIINKIKLLIPKAMKSNVNKSISQINHLLSRYFLALIIQITILFILYLILLAIVGINNILIIAFLCALLNLIPYIGPLISGFLLTILTLTNYIDIDFGSIIVSKTIYVVIGFVIVQAIDNFLIQPILFSKSVKSHPLEIFLVILVFGYIFGVTGLILAVPCYTIIKVILRTVYSKNLVVNSFFN